MAKDNNNIRENFITIVNKKITKALVGKKIISANYMTDTEMIDLGWSRRALIIMFDDNNVMYASTDDEGNNAGVLFTTIKDFETIPAI